MIEKMYLIPPPQKKSNRLAWSRKKAKVPTLSCEIYCHFSATFNRLNNMDCDFNNKKRQISFPFMQLQEGSDGNPVT